MFIDSEDVALNDLICWLIKNKGYGYVEAYYASLCWHDGLYITKQCRSDIKEWEDSLDGRYHE